MNTRNRYPHWFKSVTAVLVLAFGLAISPQLLAQQIANTDTTLSAGGWVDQGGGGNLHLAINTAGSDADYIWSAINTETAHMGLGSLTDPTTSAGHILRIRAWADDKPNQTGSLRLYENSGGTLIATYAFTIPSRRAWADLSYTLTATEANNISNYGDLSIRIENTDAADREIRISWFEMEVPSPGGSSPPTLSAPTSVNITHTTADLGGTIDSDGNDTVTAHGTVWNSSSPPEPVTPTDNPEDLGTAGPGYPDTFFSVRGDGSPAGDTALPPGTRIFYRAFASNGQGTSYSPQGSFYTEPLTQASSITFGAVTATSIVVNWTPGDGDGSLVVMRAGSAPVPPEDGTVYSANADFTLAGETGPGSRVVAASGSSVPVTGLAPGTTYFVAAYEYAGTVNDSGFDLGVNYKPNPAENNRATDAGTAAPTVDTPTAVNITHNAADLGGRIFSNGNDPVTDHGTFWNSSGSPATENASSEGPTAGPFPFIFSTTRNTPAMPSGSRIFYRAYADNNTGQGVSADASFYTEPLNQAAIGAFGTATSDSIEINWTAGSGDGSLVVISASNPPVAPTDGTVYTPNPDIGLAEQTGVGSYVVATSGTTVTASGLASSTTYYVAIYEYAGTVQDSGDDLGINYKPGPATGNDSTEAGAGSEPTVQASSIVIDVVATKAIRFKWTPGNGDGSIATIRTLGTSEVPPVDFTDYAADTDFTLAPETSGGSGNFVIYKGPGAAVTVSGLTQNTSYVLTVYAWGGFGAATDYLVTSPPSATQETNGPAMHNYDNAADCSDCHNHGGSETFVPRQASQEAVCRTCHKLDGPAAAKTEFALHLTPNYTTTPDVDCGACHEVHRVREGSANTTKSTNPVTLVTDHNRSFIRANVDKYVSTATADDAVYHVKPDDLAFEDGDGTTSRGICQACHSDAGNHRWDGTGDQCHNGQGGNCGPAQTDCFLCHTHVGNFAPSGGDCTGCHNSPQPPSSPTRRTIVQEFARATAHVPSADLVAEDCEVCHAQDVTGHLHGGEGGTDFQVTVFNADDKTTWYSLGSYADPFTDRSEATKLTPFCLSCHDLDGATDTGIQSNSLPFKNSAGTPPNIADTWSTSSHATINQQPSPDGSGSPTTCFGDGEFGCHASGHGSLKVDMLAPDTTDGGANNSGELEGFCLNCHTVNGASSIDINQYFAGLATDFQETAGPLYTTVNQKHDVLPADQSYSGAVMTCKDCHDPHAATDANPAVNPDTGANLPTYTKNDSYTGDATSFTYNWDVNDFDPTNPNGGQIATGWPTDGPYPEPDYIEFCLVCHDGVAPAGVTLPPTSSLMLNIADSYRIDDQHGRLVGNGSTSRGYMKQPWSTLTEYTAGDQNAQAYSSLNCTLCHSPHGTGNIYHLRTSITVAGQAMTVGGKDVFTDPALCTRQCDDIVNSLPEFGSTTYTLPLNASGSQQFDGWGAWCTFCHEPNHAAPDGLGCHTGHRHGGGNF